MTDAKLAELKELLAKATPAAPFLPIEVHHDFIIAAVNALPELIREVEVLRDIAKRVWKNAATNGNGTLPVLLLQDIDHVLHNRSEKQ